MFLHISFGVLLMLGIKLLKGLSAEIEVFPPLAVRVFTIGGRPYSQNSSYLEWMLKNIKESTKE